MQEDNAAHGLTHGSSPLQTCCTALYSDEATTVWRQSNLQGGLLPESRQEVGGKPLCPWLSPSLLWDFRPEEEIGIQVPHYFFILQSLSSVYFRDQSAFFFYTLIFHWGFVTSGLPLLKPSLSYWPTYNDSQLEKTNQKMFLKHCTHYTDTEYHFSEKYLCMLFLEFRDINDKFITNKKNPIK